MRGRGVQDLDIRADVGQVLCVGNCSGKRHLLIGMYQVRAEPIGCRGEIKIPRCRKLCFSFTSSSFLSDPYFFFFFPSFCEKILVRYFGNLFRFDGNWGGNDSFCNDSFFFFFLVNRGVYIKMVYCARFLCRRS